MDRYDTVIIGGGLAGLSCAIALLKEGHKVCVLEQGKALGGAFQSYMRDEMRLDAGFHYVGGVGKGEGMRPLIDYFGLGDLPWKAMDEKFMEVKLRGETYYLHSGGTAFASHLAEQFPEEREGLSALSALIEETNRKMYDTIDPQGSSAAIELMGISAKQYLDEHFKSKKLKDILCAQTVTTEIYDELPLYSFVQTLNTFTQRSYRLEGGGETLTRRLAENVKELGGTIATQAKAESFGLDSDGNVCCVKCSDGRDYMCGNVIATMHPSLTMKMVPECPQMRNIYRRRFDRMKNTIGMFTVQLKMKPGTAAYRNRCVSIFENEDLWHTPCGKGAKVESMLVHYGKADGAYARNIDLLAPMDWEAVSEWEESHAGHRPEAYNEFKRKKAAECIALAQKYLPELEGNIERIWTSTPLTYRDYTGTKEGSAFGIRKSCENPLATITSPKTPIANLYLAGQNLMLHGMLGVMMTSMLVCNTICGRNALERK